MTQLRLTDRQITALAEIITNGGSISSAATDRAGRRNLDQLAAKNLVRRIPSDGRPESYCLTAWGYRLTRKLHTSLKPAP